MVETSVCLHWLVNGDVLLLAGGGLVLLPAVVGSVDIPQPAVAGDGDVKLPAVGGS